jgi:hypothetical protein
MVNRRDSQEDDKSNGFSRFAGIRRGESALLFLFLRRQ